jgi:hypothetical protein
MMLYLDCPTCGQRREAEIPPCADGHPNGCPDRACAECGTGMIVDPPLVSPREARYQHLRHAA